jgi:hypothetical protein
VKKLRPSRPRFGAVLTAACLAISAAAQSPGLTSSKLSIRTFLDYGQLVKGSNPNGNEENGDQEIASLPLNRMNVSVVQDIAADRLDVSAGLSALVWWPYDGGISSDLKQRIVTVKPMVPVARARWRFGDTAGVSGILQVGSFNYKYNPDARNLGEYLYRSGTYPGFVWSNDGWLLMNRAGNFSHGLLATVSHGHFKHNISLFMEMLYSPVGDFSPGYDFGYKGSWLDLGGGVVFNHYLPIRPSSLRPRNDENLYVRVKDARPNAAGGVDTVSYYMPKTEIPNVVMANPQDTQVVHRWTSKGLKLMGRASLDLGRLLPKGLRSPEDLRLFGEVAVLGWGNQPFFYEKRSERIPVMLGFNLPTFRLLDLLSLQIEYYKSPFNDIDYFNSQSIPIWKTSFAKDSADRYLTDASGRIIPVADRNDDLKWSVHAKKIVNKSVTVFAQAASDHFRLTDADYRVTPVPLTGTPGEWYFLLRLEFALR